MPEFVFLNDAFVERDKAALHYSDLAFQRGYGVFDFFRLLQSEPLFLADHLDRFYSSANSLHMEVPFEKKELEELITTFITGNNLSNTGVRLSLTGGYSADGFIPAKPNFLLSHQAFSPPTQTQVAAGIKLFTFPYCRQLATVKTIDYLMAIWLQPQRIQNGADDILYHHDGFVSECPRSNIFFITTDNILITPGRNVLAGITRQKVLELASNMYRIEERPVTLAEIKHAKEAFITSTTKRILPVRQIDETVYSSSQLSLQLLHAFEEKYGA